MSKISFLFLTALCFVAGSVSAQSVSVLGITKTRTYTQTTSTATTAGDFTFSAFIEGDSLDDTSPSDSNRVTAPSGATTALVFDEDRWDLERVFTSQTALTTSFANGNYTFRVGTDAIPLSLSGAITFPNIPLITASAGTWSGGRLKLTPGEAETALTLSSNDSTGNGFLTLEVYSETEDVLSETVTNEEPPSSITAEIPGGTLIPGMVYTVEAEFDQVVDSESLEAFDWADPAAFGYALFSTRTSFEIQIVSPVLVVKGNNTLIENGSVTPSLDNHTDFESALIGSQRRRTFTISNEGTADLTLDAVSITGPDASNFTVFDQPAASVAPGGSTTFEIVFEPAVEGELNATVSFSTNDDSQPTFEMAITGQGTMPVVLDFETQPLSQLVHLGAPAVITAQAVGDEAISYKWQKNALPLVGVTDASLTISSVKTADIGTYTVIADSPFAEPVTSERAYLGVVTPDSTARVLKLGDKLTLTCTAVAPAIPGVSLSYAWRRETGPLENGTQANGAIVAGQDKATLTITKIQADDADNYVCVVTLNTLDPEDEEATLEHGVVAVEVVDSPPELDFGSLPSTISVSELMGPEVFVSANNFPTSFSVKNLPSGLKLNTKTGQITGRATKPSNKNTAGEYIPYRIAFKASNPFGTSVEEIFEMVIEPLDPGYVGTFHGIVSRDRAANFNLGGHVQITVAKTGVISGSAVLAGKKHSVVGALNASTDNEPTAELLVKRKPTSLGNLILRMNIVQDGDMQGVLYDPKFEKVSGELDLGEADEAGWVDGTTEESRFSSPGGIVLAPSGDGYIADTGNHRIRFVAQGSTVSSVAGNGAAGSSDGLGNAAAFSSPEGLALDNEGNLYIADTGNATIRRMTPDGSVTTYAGAAGVTGITNGSRLLARFNQPSALCFDPAGNLYVVDRGNHAIRKISKTGVVSTLAGKLGAPGHKDASGASAMFKSPHGIVYEPVAKALFVTDTQNFVIRKISLTGKVSTYAGSPGVSGGAEGLRANTRWTNPTGITTRGDGTLIVGDGVLCQLNPNGVVVVISDPLDAMGFSDNPVALAYLAGEKTILSVHNTLHGISSHHGAESQEEAEYFMAAFEARRQVWSSANLVPLPLRGSYNAAIHEDLPVEENPRGDGYARLSVSKTGVSSWTGKTATGTSFTFSTFMSGNVGGDDESYFAPLHSMMHKNTASLQGECFIDGETLDLNNDNTPPFDWYKIAQPLKSTDRSYKAGFNVHPRNLFGGKYVPGNIHAFLGLTATPATLDFNLTEGGLEEAIATTFSLTTPNTVTPPTGIILKIDNKTGLFTGSFKSGTPSVSSSFTGVLLQSAAASARGGYGYFLRPQSTAKNAPYLSGAVRF